MTLLGIKNPEFVHLSIVNLIDRINYRIHDELVHQVPKTKVTANTFIDLECDPLIAEVIFVLRDSI